MESRWHQPFATPVLRGGLAVAVVASGLFFTAAAPFAETVSADKWAQPLAQPTRIKGLPTGEQQAVAQSPAAPGEVVTLDKWFSALREPVREGRGILAASQQDTAFVEAAPFAETVSADRWVQPLSQPVRETRAILAASQQALALVKAAPFPEAVTSDRWVQPLSVPVRSPYTPPGHIGFVKAAPFEEATSPARWLQPFAAPNRSAPRQYTAFSYGYFVSASEIVTVDKWLAPFGQPGFRRQVGDQPSFVKAAPFPETVSFDRWGQPLSVPPARRPIAEEAALTLTEAAPFPETVSADRWVQPLSQPTRIFGLLTAGQIAFTGAPYELIRPGSWWQQLSFPVREKRGLPGQPQAAAIVEAAPFPETVSFDKWGQPFSTPVRRALQPQPQPIFVALTSTPETITMDKWFAPWREPTRLRRSEPTGPAFVKAAPFAEVISADEWAQPLSIPLRRSKQDLTFLSLVASIETVTVDKWFAPFAVPVRVSRSAETGRIALVKASPFPEATSVDRWGAAFSIPLFVRGLATSEHLAFVSATVVAIPIDRWGQPLSLPRAASLRQQPAVPATLISAEPADWFAPFSVPIRARGPELGRVVLVKAAPFAETVSADRWVQALGLPPRPLLWQPAPAPFVIALESTTLDKWFAPFSIPVREWRWNVEWQRFAPVRVARLIVVPSSMQDGILSAASVGLEGVASSTIAEGAVTVLSSIVNEGLTAASGVADGEIKTPGTDDEKIG